MSDSNYYLTDFSHMAIVGATGAGDKFGGKSVLANWMYEQSVQTGFVDLAVYFNIKGHSFVRGTKCYSLEDLVKAYNAGKRLINFVPTDPIPPKHARVIDAMRKVSGEKLFVHDESHLFDESPQLNWCFRQGGNVGEKYRTGNIRSIAVTQHPWDLEQSLRNNTPLTVWIGPKTAEAKRYFQSLQLEATFRDIPDDLEPYHWCVIDGGELIDINSPVPSEYAHAN
jgi:hypothetical protein